MVGTATLQNFPNKAKFSANDKYLIGKKTCGLYIGLASNDKTMFVNSKFVGDGVLVKKDGYILIPIIISERLTDYYGVGSSGIGNIGGVIGASNVKYTKKIGLDIIVKESKLENPKMLSFDFQYSAQYEKTSTI